MVRYDGNVCWSSKFTRYAISIHIYIFYIVVICIYICIDY